MRLCCPLLPVFLLAACGAMPGPAADPCAIATGAVSLTSLSTTIASTTLECHPTAGDATCNANVSLASASCADGYGFALSSGNTTMLLRLRSTDGTWVAGAQLSSGAPLEGSLSLRPVGDPASPVPPAGREYQGSFFVHDLSGTWNGTFVTTW
jgi:hypothetical protein